ncbi:serine/threonine-protein kinase [Streptomyces sp. NPDC059564]|uniref:serine/threonine-protein kinase n=1 Tax=Streptomyces sp. NPDC059564 TaxID=3346865 RepID=UPI0036C689CC
MSGIGIDRLAADDPTHLGGYRLLWRLASGGMGRIYLARSTAGGPLVAVKTLLAEGVVSPTDRQRFAREVQLAQRIDSTYTARVLDADPRAARPWMAIEYVPAPALSDLVRDSGPLADWAVPSIAAGTVQALLALHGKGVIHRDVKPQNVLLPLTGPLLIDFGISHAADQTRTTLTLGTIAFTSPEQARGEHSTEASDVYSLGVTLFYLAVGRLPYRQVDGPVPLLALVQGGLVDLAGLPGPLDPLISPCLALDPGDRPKPAHLLAQSLEMQERRARRRDQRWLPVEWKAMIEAYEAHGRALGTDRTATAAGGPDRPLPPPVPTLLHSRERAARREREQQAEEARRRREEELRKLARSAARLGEQRGRSGSSTSSSGGYAFAVVAALIAVALLIGKPWDSDDTSGTGSSGSSGASSVSAGAGGSVPSTGTSAGGGTSGGGAGGGGGLAASSTPQPTAERTHESTPPSPPEETPESASPTPTPTPDPTEAVFRAVSAGDCLPVYDTGEGGDYIKWSARVPPDAVPCASERAHVWVSRVTDGSCPTGADKTQWTYQSTSSGRTTRLCLNGVYHPNYCMLAKQSGDSINLGSMTMVDCRAAQVPSGYNQIMHITGVYQAPAGANTSNCRRAQGDQTRYWSWLMNDGATLLCAMIFQGA